MTDDFLEVRRGDEIDRVALIGEQFSIGRAPHNDVVLDDAGRVSRTHAVIERLAGFWCLRDLDSTNGTSVNGRSLTEQRRLFDGDEIRIGTACIVVRLAGVPAASDDTDIPWRAPALTSRERDVLRCLLQPLAGGQLVAEPASPAAIAQALAVSVTAVQRHLVNLYGKFDVPPGGKRHVRLAGEAVRRGAVRLDELRPVGGPDAR